MEGPVFSSGICLENGCPFGPPPGGTESSHSGFSHHIGDFGCGDVNACASQTASQEKGTQLVSRSFGVRCDDLSPGESLERSSWSAVFLTPDHCLSSCPGTFASDVIKRVRDNRFLMVAKPRRSMPIVRNSPFPGSTN